MRRPVCRVHAKRRFERRPSTDGLHFQAPEGFPPPFQGLDRPKGGPFAGSKNRNSSVEGVLSNWPVRAAGLQGSREASIWTQTLEWRFAFSGSGRLPPLPGPRSAKGGRALRVPKIAFVRLRCAFKLALPILAPGLQGSREASILTQTPDWRVCIFGPRKAPPSVVGNLRLCPKLKI